MTDDAECLRRYAESHDEAAFTTFVRRNVDFVYSAALRQTHGDGHLAEDITQKVFVAAAQKAAALASHPVVTAWLHQSTRFAAIDAIRSRLRRAERESAAHLLTAMNAEPEPTVEWEQVSPKLDEIIASLDERDRHAVILRFFGGKSFADIGARLHLSENAARMRVERALEKLRARLGRRGVTSSTAALGVLLANHSLTAAPATLATAAVSSALAAPAAGIITFAGALHLMTSTKITLGAATLVTLASLTFAVREHRRADQLAASAAVSPVASHIRPAAVAVPEPASPSAARPVSTNPPVAAAATPPKSGLTAVLELFDNPAMQQQNSIQAQSRIDLQYGALFKSLQLNADQVEQFKRLLVEKQMVGFDSMSAAHQQGIDIATDPKAFFQVVAEAVKSIDTQISTLLGSAGFTEFQQYQASVPARNTTNLLSQALSYTATPLTDTQAVAVTQMLATYGTPALPPGNPFTVLNGDLGVVQLNEAGLGQLQTILAPAQLQTLQAKIQLQQQLLAARKRMGR